MAGEYRGILNNTLKDKELNSRVQDQSIHIAITRSVIGNVNERKDLVKIFKKAFKIDGSSKAKQYRKGLKNGSMIIVDSFNGKTSNEDLLSKKDINYFNN